MTSKRMLLYTEAGIMVKIRMVPVGRRQRRRRSRRRRRRRSSGEVLAEAAVV